MQKNAADQRQIAHDLFQKLTQAFKLERRSQNASIDSHQGFPHRPQWLLHPIFQPITLAAILAVFLNSNHAEVEKSC